MYLSDAVMEFLQLQIDDVVASEVLLRVRRGKREKPRTLFLCPEALEALAQWRKLRPSLRREVSGPWTGDGGSARRR